MNTVPAPGQARRHRVYAASLALLCLMAAGSALAQWQWRDESGRRHFSDRPPPAGVPDKDILQRPRGAAAPAVTPADTVSGAPGAAPGATSAAAPAEKTGNIGTSAPPSRPVAPAAPESPLELRKQQIEKAEAEKRKAEEKALEDKATQARAANCASARRNKASLESGARLTVPNARGEIEYLDDTGRAAQLRQANDQIRETCR